MSGVRNSGFGCIAAMIVPAKTLSISGRCSVISLGGDVSCCKAALPVVSEICQGRSKAIMW